MALKRLRKDGELFDVDRSDIAKQPIWIDALSINQRDPTERAAQVKKMPLIFAKSRHLTIWLDEPYELQGCDELCKTFDRMESSPGNSEIILSSSEQALLRRILDRGWFQRPWCKQEVLVSLATGNTPLFRLGRATWNWPVFVKAVASLKSDHRTDQFLALSRRAIQANSSGSISRSPGRFDNNVLAALLTSLEATDYPSAKQSANFCLSMDGSYRIREHLLQC
jgi:hypothetical protein